jgi:hypothetical protein
MPSARSETGGCQSRLGPEGPVRDSKLPSAGQETDWQVSATSSHCRHAVKPTGLAASGLGRPPRASASKLPVTSNNSP